MYDYRPLYFVVVCGVDTVIGALSVGNFCVPSHQLPTLGNCIQLGLTIFVLPLF